jgi:hypothetical protein
MAAEGRVMRQGGEGDERRATREEEGKPARKPTL